MKEDYENPAIIPELLPPTADAERASVDAAVATAHRFPRSLESFRKRAASFIANDPATAESCIYRRPVGSGKFASGMSIRLAEIVAAAYGNLRVRTQIVSVTPTRIIATGRAWDMESNLDVEVSVIEPTIKADGTPYDERMRTLTMKVAVSKAYRDAILRVVPRHLTTELYRLASEVVGRTKKTIAERHKAVKEWLATIGVDERRMFNALQVGGWADLGEEQLEILTGIKTAIADGDISVEEAFPKIKPKTEAIQQLEPKPTEAKREPPTPVEVPKVELSEVEQIRSKLLLAGLSDQDFCDRLVANKILRKGETLDSLTKTKAAFVLRNIDALTADRPTP